MDIKTFAGKDFTEIGERGINLSGGQKQRVALARAMYSGGDIFLIDDSLSALDNEVGQKIFSDLIKKEWANKTRILVTHATHILPDCDKIVLMKKGKICFEGKYEEIKEKEEFVRYLEEEKEHEEKEKIEKNPIEKLENHSIPEISSKEQLSNLEDLPNIEPAEYYQLDENSKSIKEGTAEIKETHKNPNSKNTYNTEMNETERSLIPASMKNKVHPLPATDENLVTGILTKKEKRQQGTTQIKTLLRYIAAFGFIKFIMFLLLNLIHFGIRFQIDNLLISYATARDEVSFTEILIFMAIFTFMTLVRIGIYCWGLSSATKDLHQRLCVAIFRRKMSFFDTTPVGQILNRFTKDFSDLDAVLPSYLYLAIYGGTKVLVSISTAVIAFPPILFFLLLVFLTIMRISGSFTKTMTDLKRILHVGASPLMSRISEIYSGARVLILFKNLEKRKNLLIKAIDELTLADSNRIFYNIWKCVEMDMVINTIILAASISLVLVKLFPFGLIEDGYLLSLVFMWVIQVTDFAVFFVFCCMEVSSSMANAERILEMCDAKDELEKPWQIPALPETLGPWPSKGELVLEDVKLRYREKLPLVLKGIDLKIQAGEKVGVVGRTGSGKSTLILSLLRMVEMEKEGKYFIDGVDANKIGLHLLRGALCVIPQDPYLTKGDLRSNIDPLKEFEDSEILRVLEETQLTKYLSNSEEKTSLKYKIDTAGANLSVGQRQLVCIARAIVRRPKILLMDEATANIDTKTDQIIQRLIREKFENSTILTIAHRVNTIINYDKILFMREGKVGEYGAPDELLQKPEGLFYGFIKEGGENYYEEMNKMAKERNGKGVVLEVEKAIGK